MQIEIFDRSISTVFLFLRRRH